MSEERKEIPERKLDTLEGKLDTLEDILRKLQEYKSSDQAIAKNLPPPLKSELAKERIAAIKAYRERTGLGLANCRRAILYGEVEKTGLEIMLEVSFGD